MSPRAPHAVLCAMVLAGCSPAVGRRPAVATDTAAATAPSAAVAAPSAAVTRDDHPIDSLRGVAERIGSDPTTRLVVRAADGAVCALQIAVPPPLEGLEVTLWGQRDLAATTLIPGVSCAFAAERYAVRAVDGIAAVDGLLRSDGTSYALETADGARRPLRDVPTALRAQVGARIFWAGPLDRAPAAYGVLLPTP